MATNLYHSPGANGKAPQFLVADFYKSPGLSAAALSELLGFTPIRNLKKVRCYCRRDSVRMPIIAWTQE